MKDKIALLSVEITSKNDPSIVFKSNKEIKLQENIGDIWYKLGGKLELTHIFTTTGVKDINQDEEEKK